MAHLHSAITRLSLYLHFTNTGSAGSGPQLTASANRLACDAGSYRADVLTSPVLSRAESRDWMPKETTLELAQALDRLLDALHSAFDLGSDAGTRIPQALHECATIARGLGLTPEDLLLALKPRLERVAARAPEEAREAYLRAITALAIESFIRGR